VDTIYLDNSATSYPKPDPVIESICSFMQKVGANPGRGGHSSSLSASRLILETRELIGEFFGGRSPEEVILTQNITHALNIVIKGYLNQNDHVITTKYEHNSVLRPLNRLKSEKNISYDFLPISKEGDFNLNSLDKLKRDNTNLIIISHASNVSGVILNIKKAIGWAKYNNIPIMIDTAQTAGTYKFNWQELNADFIGFTGHKGFMGPAGTGGLIISKEMAEKTKPFIEGGTGSKSDLLTQPDLLPDKYEAGTQNSPGIAGLNAAIKFINQKGIKNIDIKMKDNYKILHQGLADIDGINIIGPKNLNNKVSTISLTFNNHDPAEIGFTIDKDYGIMARTGLHCAPLAHKTLGTYPEGTLRLSPGYFTTEAEIEKTIKAFKDVLS